MNEIKFWKLQKQCSLSNQQCADYLEVNISSIKRYRNGSKSPPVSIMRDLQQLADSKAKTS